MFRSKKAKAEDLMANGARGVGTIIDVRDTGMTINDNPRVKMTFQIEPLDGSAAFTAEKTKTVSRVRIPQMGCRYPIFYDKEDPSTFAFVEVDDAQGYATIVQMFGDKFGADGMGVGRPAAAAAPAPAAAPAAEDPIEKIRKLEELKNQGILTEEEFAAKKTELLAEI
jgi:hypothetical protein